MEVLITLMIGLLLLFILYWASTSEYRKRQRAARQAERNRIARRRALIEKLEREMPQHIRERRARSAARSNYAKK